MKRMYKRKGVCVVCGSLALIGKGNKFCSRKHQLKYRDMYREKNKDKIGVYGKQYREKNKDKIKQYREKNKDKIKAQIYAARERNRGAYDAYQAKYRAEHSRLKRDTRGNYG